MGFLKDIIEEASKSICMDGPRKSPLDIVISNPFKSRGSSRSGSILDVLTSDEDDKRLQAELLIAEAKQLVKEGDEIYKRAKADADRASRRAQEASDDYIEFCKETADLLDTEVKPVMKRFDEFNIDSKISSPHINSMISIPKIPSIAGLTESFVNTPYSSPDLFGMILDEYQYKKAKEQRDKANAYKEEMKSARSKLNALRDKMNNITTYIESEQEEIEALTQKVLHISEQLEDAMQHTSFTPARAKNLKAIRAIADMISKQISTEFITNDLEISDKYKKQAKVLREINKAIPSSPSIDEQVALNILRDIGDFIYY